MKTRGAVNEVTSQIIQRGQVFTWEREVKRTRFRAWGVTAVVNFWPKTDAELGELGLDFAMQVSLPRSEMVLDDHVSSAADMVAGYLLGHDSRRVLVLCEAGKTRSVFFSVLLVKRTLGLSYAESLSRVRSVVRGLELKPAMLMWLGGADGDVAS